MATKVLPSLRGVHPGDAILASYIAEGNYITLAIEEGSHPDKPLAGINLEKKEALELAVFIASQLGYAVLSIN